MAEKKKKPEKKDKKKKELDPFEKAIQILEEYEEGTPPRDRLDIE